MLLICSASSMVITRRRANVASCSTNASAKRSRSWANACLKSSGPLRSEEHTSELQSLRHLVCRLLLEKKNVNDTLPIDRLRKHDRGGRALARAVRRLRRQLHQHPRAHVLVRILEPDLLDNRTARPTHL